MFSGIVEEMGTAAEITQRSGSSTLTLRAVAVLDGTRIGDSIAVNGTCLTVVRSNAETFDVHHHTQERKGGVHVGIKRHVAGF